MKIQLGHTITMVVDNKNCKIIHYGINKCKMSLRSVMAAKIQAVVLGFDYFFILKDLFEEVICHKMRLEAMIDSTTEFDVV